MESFPKVISHKKSMFLIIALLFIAASFIIVFSSVEDTSADTTEFNDPEGRGYTFTILDENSVSIKSYNGNDTVLTIPDTVTYNETTYNITVIGDHAFYCEDRLTEIIFGSNITEVKDAAFCQCDDLISVTMNKGLLTIGQSAFASSGLRSICIPDTVTSTGKYVFQHCRQLESAVIGSGLTVINEGMFNVTSLISVIIPDNIQSIEDGAFTAIDGLITLKLGKNISCINNGTFDTIHLAEICNDSNLVIEKGALWENGGIARYAVNVYSSEDGNSIIKYQELSDGSVAVYFSDNKGTHLYTVLKMKNTLTLPDTLDGKSYDVWENAFLDDLESLTIGSGITDFDSFAFRGDIGEFIVVDNNPYFSSENGVLFNKDKSTLIRYPGGNDSTSYTVPATVTALSDCSFYSCGSLKNLILPDGLISIGEFAFSYCTDLSSIAVPNSTTELGYGAFSKCEKLESAIIGDGVQVIQYYTFDDCSDLNTLTIGRHVNSISYATFDDCTELKNVVNNSMLNIVKGSEDYGKVAYYADTVIGEIKDYSNGLLTGKYNTNSSIASVSGYCGSPETLVFGSVMINDIECTVVEISDSAFLDCTTLVSVTINDTVIKIGTGVFSGCTSLTTVVLPSNMKEIGKDLFKGCSSLNSVNIPDEISSIGDNAFYECESLTSAITLNSVTSIGYSAFQNCSSLSTVSLGYGLTIIKANTFKGCRSLTSIAIPDSVTSIGYSAFSECSSLSSVSLSNNLTEISSCVFSKCESLTSVNIPDSVTSIGYSAFSECSSLSSVSFGDNLKNIESYSFSKCVSLTSVDIPLDVTSIGDSAFSECSSLISLYLDKNLETIGGNAFAYCKLMLSVSIPDNTKSVGSYAFYNCSALSDLTLGTDLVTIGDYAFSQCVSLPSVVIPDRVTTIGSNAFSGCSFLNSISFGNGITCISKSAFSGCSSLRNVILGNDLGQIQDYAFMNCVSLRFVHFEKSVSTISEYSFEGCTALEEFDVSAENPNYSSHDGILFSKDMKELLLYPQSKAGSSYTVPDTVETVSSHSFKNCKELISIDLSNTTDILTEAFSGCSNLRSVEFGSKIMFIGDDAFSYCVSLTSATFSGELDTISSNAFENCTSLKSIDFGNSVKKIMSKAFYKCESLATISLPDSVTEIGNEAFSECVMLRSASLGNGVISIGERIFYNCESLNSIDLGDSLEEIGYYAFSRCSSLRTIALPASITSIGSAVFYCTSLTEITIPEENNSYCSVNGILFDKEKTTLVRYPISKTGESYAIPETVKTVDGCAFEGCRYLKTITIGTNVENIGFHAFAECPSLLSLNIPDSVTSIDSGFVNYCSNLESIVIGSGVQTLDTFALADCKSIRSITVSENNKNYSSLNGVLFDKNKTALIKYPAMKTDVSYTIPDTVITVCDSAFNSCRFLVTVNIGQNVESIECEAFMDSASLETVNFGCNVKYINSRAFANCSLLKAIAFNDGLETVSYSSFANCESLTNIEIPASVSKIEDSAFAYCDSLKSFTVSDENTSYCAIDGVLFDKDATRLMYYPSDKESTSYAIPNSVVNVYDYAFNNCSHLTSLTIGSNVKQITTYNLNTPSLREIIVSDENKYRCSENGVLFNIDKTVLLLYPSGKTDMSYTIPSSVTSIASSSFCGNVYLREITIPAGVKEISYTAFASCTSLESVIIPDTVEYIYSDAFTSCTALKYVKIGNNVNEIDSFAFRNCPSLENIDVSKDNKTYRSEDGILFSKDMSVLVRYPAARAATSYTVPESVSVIDDGAFRDCVNLETLAISKNVCAIGGIAFVNCTSLKTIEVSDDNTSFRSINGILYNKDATVLFLYPCAKTSAAFDLPDTVVYIQYLALGDIDNLQEIRASANNQYFSSEDGVLFSKDKSVLFRYPSAKTDSSYTVPNSVIQINDGAFYDSTNLTSLKIGNKVVLIGYETFVGCTSLTQISIPANVDFSIIWYDIVDAFCGMKFYDSEGNTEISNYAALPGFTYIGESADKLIRHELVNVIFDENGGSETIDGIYEYEGYEFTLPDYEGIVTGHEFTGWSYNDVVYPAGSKITKTEGDMTFTAVWNLTKHYAVFMNGEEEFSKIQYEYGDVIVAPSGTPVKASTAQYDFVFSEWKGFTEGMTITQDITFDAVYDSSLRSYEVIFTSDEKVVKKSTLDYGDIIEAPANDPVKEPTPEFEYKFAEWSGFTEGMTVSGNHIFSAIFSENVRQYTVTFSDEGKTYASYKMDYGSEIKLPAEPKKTGTETYDYRFTGWVGYTEGMKVSGDATFTSSYEAVLKKVVTTDDKVIIDTKELTDVKATSEMVDQIRAAGNDGKSAEITLSKGKISLDKESAAGLPADETTISLNDADRSKIPSDIKEKIGDRPVYSISIGDVHEFKGTLTVSVKYDLRDGEKADDVCIWYLKSDGTYEKISCTYTDGYATFETSHLSEYAVMIDISNPASSGSGSNVGLIIGIVVGSIVIVALAAFLIVKKRK